MKKVCSIFKTSTMHMLGLFFLSGAMVHSVRLSVHCPRMGLTVNLFFFFGPNISSEKTY